jgi:hypothetical protein
MSSKQIDKEAVEVIRLLWEYRVPTKVIAKAMGTSYQNTAMYIRGISKLSTQKSPKDILGYVLTAENKQDFLNIT